MNAVISLMVFGLLFFSLNCFGLKPTTVEQLKETSVRIYNLEMNSGGTGSIFKSYKSGSHILTNKHVCRLIEQGGYVVKDGRKYMITHYKKFKHHDLCLVRTQKSFGINLDVSTTLSKPSQLVHVSGHPNLLPHIVTKGHLSDPMQIQLVIGLKECNDEESENFPMECAMFGDYPVIKEFESQVVSNLIKPGSSGSAVFNMDGEIVGVVFAGSGRDFSHGFIVPQIHVLYFIQNAHRFEWVKVGTEVDSEGFSERFFNFTKCEIPEVLLNKELNKFCKTVKDPMIWRE